MIIDQLLIAMLAADAAYVAYGLYRKKIMWKWIVGYWCILTTKNLYNLFTTLL